MFNMEYHITTKGKLDGDFTLKYVINRANHNIRCYEYDLSGVIFI